MHKSIVSIKKPNDEYFGRRHTNNLDSYYLMSELINMYILFHTNNLFLYQTQIKQSIFTLHEFFYVLFPYQWYFMMIFSYGSLKWGLCVDNQTAL